MKECYILLADTDGTLRSVDEPFGVAVKTEEEAKKFVKDGGVGYTHSYDKVIIFDSKDEALKWYREKWDKMRQETLKKYLNLSNQQ